MRLLPRFLCVSAACLLIACFFHASVDFQQAEAPAGKAAASAPRVVPINADVELYCTARSVTRSRTMTRSFNHMRPAPADQHLAAGGFDRSCRLSGRIRTYSFLRGLQRRGGMHLSFPSLETCQTDLCASCMFKEFAEICNAREDRRTTGTS